MIVVLGVGVSPRASHSHRSEPPPLIYESGGSVNVMKPFGREWKIPPRLRGFMFLIRRTADSRQPSVVDGSEIENRGPKNHGRA